MAQPLADHHLFHRNLGGHPGPTLCWPWLGLVRTVHSWEVSPVSPREDAATATRPPTGITATNTTRATPTRWRSRSPTITLSIAIWAATPAKVSTASVTSAISPNVWPADVRAAAATLSLLKLGVERAQTMNHSAPAPPSASASTARSRNGTNTNQIATPTTAVSTAERE